MKEELELAIAEPTADNIMAVHRKISDRTVNITCERCLLAALSRIRKYYYLKFENVPTTN